MQLAALLRAAWEVRNFGINGVTALSHTYRPLRSTAALADVALFSPDVVILGLGSNDAAMYDAVRRNFTDDYPDIVRQLRSLPSRPHLVILTGAATHARPRRPAPAQSCR